ncbi:MAG: hypothetical protein ABI142_03555 [Bryocella sp.]
MRYTIAIVAALSLSTVAFSQVAATSPTNAVKKHLAVSAKRQAARMVPAAVVLDNDIDSAKVKRGAEFKTTLGDKVQLTDGPLLPKGTKLVGVVGQDDMNTPGTTKLSLRFTEAVLKNGTKIPIKATIITAYKLDDNSGGEGSGAGTASIPSSWNDGTLRVDQIGVEKGVDLHSRIASANSGTFVATSNHSVKLLQDSELALALSARIPRTQIAK